MNDLNQLIVSMKYLHENPNHVFVYGDNWLRQGKAGAAVLRDEPNTYGFITKKRPSGNNDAFYHPDEYRVVFLQEMVKLVEKIESYPEKTYLISQLGSGLANRYHIWEKVIQPGLEKLRRYPNVRLLYE